MRILTSNSFAWPLRIENSGQSIRFCGIIRSSINKGTDMKYLHTMIRVSNLEQSLDFFINTLGFVEQRRYENEKGRFTLVFVACPESPDAPIELTYNWDPEVYTGGRNFGHLAIGVDNIFDYCAALQNKGVVINRPPRDGRMAFVKTPDGISIEILQKGEALPLAEPWTSMANAGSW
jgi:lactoylglutathione lyase